MIMMPPGHNFTAPPPSLAEELRAVTGLDVFELAYPLGLRNDGRAVTFADSDGSTYLQPLVDHDFVASVELGEAGLSSGIVVSNPEGPIAIQYNAETDLVTLPALFNASIQSEQGHADIVDVLVRTGMLLAAAKERCGFVPVNLTLNDLAIERSLGTAELLAPFAVDDDALSVEHAFVALQKSVASGSANQEQVDVITACFDRARNVLGW